MKKMLRMLAAMLSLIMVFSCAAVAEESTEGLIATVNGVPVPIDDAFAEYDMYADYYEMYGVSAQGMADLREDIASYYIQQHLLYAKADELGLSDALDKEQLQTAAEDMYEETVQAIIGYIGSADATDEENRAAAIEYMDAEGYTLDSAYMDAFNNARLQALIEHYTSGVAVTEDEVRVEYDAVLADQMKRYTQYISNYKSDYDKGEYIIYTPDGVRFVKHILISLSDADQSTLSTLNIELGTIESNLAKEGADAESLNARKAEIEAEIETIYATVMPTIEEIQGKIEAGEDFLTLMEQYGEDPGMQEGSASYEKGYMVWENCVNWVQPFTEGSMSLNEIGEVSGPVRTSYGIHLIRYESDVQGQTLTFEETQETLYESLMKDKKNEIFMAELDSMYESAEIEMYLDNLETMRQAKHAAEAAAE